MLRSAISGGGTGIKLATQAVILPMALRQKAGPASNTSRVQLPRLPHTSDLLRTITAPAELLLGPSGRTQLWVSKLQWTLLLFKMVAQT